MFIKERSIYAKRYGCKSQKRFNQPSPLSGKALNKFSRRENLFFNVNIFACKDVDASRELSSRFTFKVTL